MEITQDIWAATPEGEAMILYTLTNASGASVQVTNLGAALVSVRVPDRDGRLADVALGYKDPLDYFGDGPWMGKSVGRYANRIAGARFSLDGVEYRLPPNERRNQLHGGAASLANKLWEGRVENNRVVFAIASPDGEGGYPGNLRAEAAYHWNDECELEIVYAAASDAPTVVNFTNHAYFNLAGEGSGSVLGHELQLRASHFLPTDHESIPTGEIRPVEGTPMDFRYRKALGRDIVVDYDQLVLACGYDHCWAVDGWRKNILAEVGTLTEPNSGRRMTILSSQPGIQLYTGNFLQGSPTGKSGRAYDNREGLALECQGFPDAPNHPAPNHPAPNHPAPNHPAPNPAVGDNLATADSPGFPDQTLRPGERYIQKIVYRFETAD